MIFLSIGSVIFITIAFCSTISKFYMFYTPKEWVQRNLILHGSWILKYKYRNKILLMTNVWWLTVLYRELYCGYTVVQLGSAFLFHHNSVLPSMVMLFIIIVYISSWKSLVVKLWKIFRKISRFVIYQKKYDSSI